MLQSKKHSFYSLFIIYELDAWSRELNSDFNWKDCLFGGVKLAENAEQDKYG